MYTSTALMTTETTPVMLKRKLGEGSTASVYAGRLTSSGKRVAVKVVRKVDPLVGRPTAATKRNLLRIRSEASIMKKLDHRHICRCYGSWETNDAYYLFLKLAKGGDLLDRLGEDGSMTEPIARRHFRQLLSAVSHLHAIGIAHRDINPQNILLDEFGNFMLADFGLMSPFLNGGKQLCGRVGTFPYTAPEMILGQPYNGPEVDVFSCGAVLAAMLTGCVPFGAEREEETQWLLLCGTIDLPEYLSPEAKHLIESMVEADPKRRITLEGVLRHPWVRGERFGSSLSSWCNTTLGVRYASIESGSDEESSSEEEEEEEDDMQHSPPKDDDEVLEHSADQLQQDLPREGPHAI